MEVLDERRCILLPSYRSRALATRVENKSQSQERYLKNRAALLRSLRLWHANLTTQTGQG